MFQRREYPSNSDSMDYCPHMPLFLQGNNSIVWLSAVLLGLNGLMPTLAPFATFPRNNSVLWLSTVPRRPNGSMAYCPHWPLLPHLQGTIAYCGLALFHCGPMTQWLIAHICPFCNISRKQFEYFFS